MLTSMEKKGFLIVNAYIGEQGFAYAYERLRAAAQHYGHALTLKTNAELLFDASTGELFSAERPDFAVFWDKDIRLAFELEALGTHLYNSARAVALCDDKSLTHMALAKAGLPMPKTVAVPFTYPRAGYGDFSFLKEAERLFPYPMVIKECFGSYGQQVYLAQNESEAKAILGRTEPTPALLQQFIEESAGRDARLIVVGGRLIAAMLRKNPSDFRANLANGGTAEAYTPSAQEEALALAAASALGLDFCGVDLLFSKNGPLVCEVNSNAQFKGIFLSTGVDVAERIMEHVLKKEGLL